MVTELYCKAGRNSALTPLLLSLSLYHTLYRVSVMRIAPETLAIGNPSTCHGKIAAFWHVRRNKIKGWESAFRSFQYFAGRKENNHYPLRLKV